MKKFVVVAVVLLALVGFGWSQACRISGDCMEPAINDGRLYLLDRISPLVRQYRTGDIVVFAHEEKKWISRIIALEGDSVMIAEGKIVVNGKALQENICRNWSGWEYGTFAVNVPFTVPRGNVFVLSDNLSAQHDDSRVFGPIAKSVVSGLVW